jgi:hypothetical protein
VAKVDKERPERYINKGQKTQKYTIKEGGEGIELSELMKKIRGLRFHF